MPRRLKRKNYFEPIPPGAVLVAAPSKFKNPCRDKQVPLAERLAIYWRHLDEHPKLVAAAKRELRGKDVVCYCELDQDCHGDILPRVANS
jgi:hypothetical protein